MPDRDDLDGLLDSALSTYGAPSSGFEARLLHSIAAAERTAPVRRPRRLAWAIAVPAAACLVVALFVYQHARMPHTSGSQQAQRAAASSRTLPVEGSHGAPVEVAVRHHATHAAARSIAAAPVPMPKRDVFPTPQPLTAEEKTLAVAATSNSTAERNALLQANEPVTPLNVASIKIPPLVASDDGKN